MTAMRVDAFDFVRPRKHRAGSRESAGQRADAGCWRRWRLTVRARARPAGLSHTPRCAGRQRYPSHCGAARWRAGQRRGRRLDRSDVDRARRRLPLAGARAAGQRLKVGERIRFGEASESMACLLAALDAEVEDKGEAGEVLLRFEFTGAALDEAIERLGAPPCRLHRLAARFVAQRPADYQTMFAAKPGAVAAPTAGCTSPHRWLPASRRAASRCIAVTLHVGAGLSRRSGSRIRATTRCIPNGVRSARPQPKR